MVWQNISPIPVGRRGVISSFKWFLPVFASRRGRGRESAPCVLKSASFTLRGSTFLGTAPSIHKLSFPFPNSCAGILEQSMGTRKRVGIGLSYRPARLHISLKNTDSYLLKPALTEPCLPKSCLPYCLSSWNYGIPKSCPSEACFPEAPSWSPTVQSSFLKCCLPEILESWCPAFLKTFPNSCRVKLAFRGSTFPNPAFLKLLLFLKVLAFTGWIFLYESRLQYHVVDSHFLTFVHFLSSGCEHSTSWMRYIVKKVRGFPVPRRDVTYQTPTGRE